MRRDGGWVAAAIGGGVIGLGLAWLLREKATPEPHYRVLASERQFEIRSYPPLTVAETVVHGERKAALNEGYRILSDSLTASSRPGERLPMRVPVLEDARNPMASDPPVFDDEVEGGWRVRFVMPEGELPEPPEGVTLTGLPSRRMGVVSFHGTADDRRLATAEDRLRGWLARRGERWLKSEPEFGFYNSPMIPPMLRRCEVLLPLA